MAFYKFYLKSKTSYTLSWLEYKELGKKVKIQLQPENIYDIKHNILYIANREAYSFIKWLFYSSGQKGNVLSEYCCKGREYSLSIFISHFSGPHTGRNDIAAQNLTNYVHFQLPIYIFFILPSWFFSIATKFKQKQQEKYCLCFNFWKEKIMDVWVHAVPANVTYRL